MAATTTTTVTMTAFTTTTAATTTRTTIAAWSTSAISPDISIIDGDSSFISFASEAVSELCRDFFLNRLVGLLQKTILIATWDLAIWGQAHYLFKMNGFVGERMLSILTVHGTVQKAITAGWSLPISGTVTMYGTSIAAARWVGWSNTIALPSSGWHKQWGSWETSGSTILNCTKSYAIPSELRSSCRYVYITTKCPEIPSWQWDATTCSCQQLHQAKLDVTIVQIVYFRRFPSSKTVLGTLLPLAPISQQLRSYRSATELGDSKPAT